MVQRLVYSLKVVFIVYILSCCVVFHRWLYCPGQECALVPESYLKPYIIFGVHVTMLFDIKKYGNCSKIIL